MINLRPYQVESIEVLRAGIANGHKRQILCAPTGSGKSICAVELIRLASERGSRTLFAVDRRNLVHQFSEHLDSFGISHGVIMAKTERWDPQALTQIASLQTLEKLDKWPPFNLLCLDEAHVTTRKSVREYLKNYPATVVVGLSATPFNSQLIETYTNVVNVITMKELVNQEFLVPFKVFCATAINTSTIKVSSDGEWDETELETESLSIIGDIVKDYLDISQQVWGETKKTICFAPGVAFGRELAQRFAAVGKLFIPISYLDKDEDKEAAIADFRRPDTKIDGLISTDILTRGFDVPDVEHLIAAKPLRRSFTDHVQELGRAARIYPGKQFAVVQCNSGNYLRFQKQWDDLYANGIKELPTDKLKAPQEPKEEEKKACTCPRCKALFPSSLDICATCGYVRERKSRVEEVAGQLFELNSDKPVLEKEEKYSMAYKQAFYSGLLAYAATKLFYKEGWAAAQFKDKFKVWPNKMVKVQGEITPDIRKWITYKQIKFAYGKRKTS